MQLSDLKAGQKARITAITPRGDQAYRQRLIAMGLLPGTELVLLRQAPFGDPVQILIRGVELSLRKNEASILQIEQAEEVG
jgi:Fe2+ transport system protein FeoA